MTTGAVRIVVDGPAVAKGRPRIARGGFAYTPAKTRQYESYIKVLAGQAMGGRPPLDGALVVRVTAHLPVPRSWSNKKRLEALGGTLRPVSRPDLDNYLKAALDACNGIVFADDSAVCELVAAKRYAEVPRLEIEVRPA